LATGLPVVCTRIPDVEFLEKEGCGCLVDAGSVNEMKSVLAGLLYSVGRRQEMSRNAKRLANERFSWDKSFAQVMTVCSALTVSGGALEMTGE